MKFSAIFALCLAGSVIAKGGNKTVSPEKAMIKACDKMADIQQLQALVANETKLAEKTKNNATKIEKLKAKAANETAMLDTLQSNTTLTTFCSVQDTKAQCKEVKSLTKMIQMSTNTTALNAKFDNNATKIEKYQAKAAKAQTKLQTLMSNSTLLDACSSLNVTLDTTAAAAAAAASTSSSSDSKSAGELSARPVGTVVSMMAFLMTALFFL